MSTLKTHVDLATRLAMPVSTVIELRKREGWPHVKVGRAVRFTDAQIDEIIASHTTVDQPKEVDANPFGERTSRSAKKRAG